VVAPLVEIVVDGRRVHVREGAMLAAALHSLGVTAYRTSVTGEPRGPVCGMGICFECRVTINGAPHQRSCLVPCESGMIVETASGRGDGDD
jgi:sarcosine oxidase subunit alpha